MLSLLPSYSQIGLGSIYRDWNGHANSRFEFHRVSNVIYFFIFLFFAAGTFPGQANSADKWLACCGVASLEQARLPVLSSHLLTLLKKWYFSRLFIKLPKEHLSWGANKRGTGEECIHQAANTCHPAQPTSLGENVSGNRGPGRRYMLSENSGGI